MMSDHASAPYKNLHFPFLAHPPPARTRAAPTAPLPPTPPPKSAAILSWAATVQPGSPAPRSPSLASPRRRASISSTASSPRRRRRRPSVASILSLGSGAAAVRSPSVADKFDLTALGYTSVFVHLPKTPTTPSPLLRAYDLKYRTPAPAPTKEPAPKRKLTMRRFRSLSILRPRNKQQPKGDATAPASPTKVTSPTSATTPGSASKAEICAATIAKRKRAKYAYVRPPPTLAQELAVMQFADGGKLETHIHKVMEEQARLAAGSRSRTGGVGVGVADVYRDDKGGVWWDADEEMEYAHLLGGETAQDALMRGGGDGDRDVEMGWEWEAFGGEAAEPLAPFLNFQALRTAPLPTTTTTTLNLHAPNDDDRRSSFSSMDSDLDPQYLLPLPENEDRRGAVDDRVLASRRIGGPGMSVLSLPSRPRRAALHLAKPASFLVGEVFAFKSASSESPPPSSETFSSHEKENAGLKSPKPKGKARRRPAPLKLANSAHAHGHRSRHGHHQRAHVATHAAAPPPTGALPPIPAPAPAPINITPAAAPAPLPVPDAAPDFINIPTPRREFIEDSFAPAPLPALAPPTPTPSHAPSKTAAFRGVKGLFGLKRKASAFAVAVAN